MLQFTKQTRQFFGKNISRVHGQKCCPYKQNGKPLSQEKVETFLNQDPEEKQMWNPNEDFTRLSRSFYLENIFCAVEFVKDVYEMDAETTKQIPNISILDQDIVRIDLHTKQLKGLSYRDLELAMIIDSFNFEKYKLLPLEKEKGYKRIIRMKKLDE